MGTDCYMWMEKQVEPVPDNVEKRWEHVPFSKHMEVERDYDNFAILGYDRRDEERKREWHIEPIRQIVHIPPQEFDRYGVSRYVREHSTGWLRLLLAEHMEPLRELDRKIGAALDYIDRTFYSEPDPVKRLAVRFVWHFE